MEGTSEEDAGDAGELFEVSKEQAGRREEEEADQEGPIFPEQRRRTRECEERMEMLSLAGQKEVEKETEGKDGEEEEEERRGRQGVVSERGEKDAGDRAKHGEEEDEAVEDDPVVSDELVFLDFPELSSSLFFSPGDSASQPFSSSVVSLLQSSRTKQGMAQPKVGSRQEEEPEARSNRHLVASSSSSPASSSSSRVGSGAKEEEEAGEEEEEEEEAHAYGSVRIAKTLSKTRESAAAMSRPDILSERARERKRFCTERRRRSLSGQKPDGRPSPFHQGNSDPVDEETHPTTPANDATSPPSSSSSSPSSSSSFPSSSSPCTVEFFGLESSSQPLVLVNGCLSFSGRYAPEPPLETIVFLEERQSIPQQPSRPEEQKDEEGKAEFLRGHGDPSLATTGPAASSLPEEKKNGNDEKENEEDLVVGMCTKTIEFVVDLQGRALRLSRSRDERQRQKEIDREGERERQRKEEEEETSS